MHYESGLTASKLMEVERVLAEARKARDGRRHPLLHGRGMAQPEAADMDAVVAMVKGVKALGMETCMTLGMLDRAQSEQLSHAGSTTTTTISIRRSATIKKSSPPAASPIGS